MEAKEIHFDKIVCDDAGIQEHAHKLIPTNCLPAKGDFIEIDGVSFECVFKYINLQNGVPYITLELQTRRPEKFPE